MVHVRESRAMGVITWVVLLGMVCQAALGREVKLTIYPQRASAEAGKYSLLPPPALLTDGDAVPWYEKAVKALPDQASYKQIQQWLKMPIEQLPAEQVEEVLKQCVQSFKCVAQAVKCRECNWPAVTDVTAPMPNLAAFRRLGVAIRLWARYEIAQDNHEGAILALRTGFGMAGHVAQAPTLVQFLVGMAMTGAMCGEIEQYVQTEDAPNLHAALAALPRPFVDMEKVIESEKKVLAKALLSEPPAGMTRAQFESGLKQSQDELETSYERLRFTAKRSDSDLALWQCIEAIRSHAASHGGQLPQTLTEIKDIAVPQDPMTGAAFRYTRTGAAAVLESPTPPGNKDKVIRYEIVVKN